MDAACSQKRVLDFLFPVWGEEQGPDPLQDFKVTGESQWLEMEQGTWAESLWGCILSYFLSLSLTY